MKKLSIGMILGGALLAFNAFAQSATPVGLWKNIDDVSGKPKALIRISESDGVLQGKIEKLYREPSEDPNPKCDKCDGNNKDKPIIGMTILRGLKADGAIYDGGTIIDPHNGATYKCKMTLVDNGKKLDVRGYIGFSLLGRTQTWIREE